MEPDPNLPNPKTCITKPLEPIVGLEPKLLLESDICKRHMKRLVLKLCDQPYSAHSCKIHIHQTGLGMLMRFSSLGILSDTPHCAALLTSLRCVKIIAYALTQSHMFLPVAPAWRFMPKVVQPAPTSRDSCPLKPMPKAASES